MYYNLHRQLQRDVTFVRQSWKNAITGRIHLRLIGTPARRLVCTGCGGDFEKDPGPVLYDKVWSRIANRRELLCHQCVMKRLPNLSVFYHVINCPWNIDFIDPFVIARFGPTGRCWWRGPSAMRIRTYGSYVYDRAAVVRFIARYEAALVAGDK